VEIAARKEKRGVQIRLSLLKKEQSVGGFQFLAVFLGKKT